MEDTGGVLKSWLLDVRESTINRVQVSALNAFDSLDQDA